MRRRRRLDSDHENHDRWLISYADFITLLFAFFVVMYALSAVNESKYRILASSLGVAFGGRPVVLTHVVAERCDGFVQQLNAFNASQSVDRAYATNWLQGRVFVHPRRRSITRHGQRLKHP